MMEPDSHLVEVFGLGCKEVTMLGLGSGYFPRGQRDICLQDASL